MKSDNHHLNSQCQSHDLFFALDGVIYVVANISKIMKNYLMTNEEPVRDVNSEPSKKVGLIGTIETTLRKFSFFSYIITITLVSGAYIIAIGSALTPGIYLYSIVSNDLANTAPLLKAFYLGCTVAIGFVGFILSIILVVPLLNAPVLPFVKPYRGPWFSLESIPWFYHNSLTYLVRYTILDFITPTPLNIFFFRMMGMKIGKGCMINTSNISDPALIQLGNHVTIGGSAYMMAHYGMKGFLVIDGLKIGDGSNVGLNAKILGGVTLGKKVMIAPNSAVLPKTVLPDNARFGMPDKNSAS